MEFGNFRGFEVSLRDPGIAWVRFNQPERLNGMTHHLKRDLREALLQAQFDDAVRVVVITGSGRAFSAGDDITGRADQLRRRRPAARRPHRQRPPQPHGDLLRPAHDLAAAQQGRAGARQDHHRRVNGVAVQTGLSLALACDFRIAAESARLTSGTLRFGLLPDEGGHKLMVQHMGVTKAMEFCLRMQFAGAQEALELGMLNEVVPDDELEERTMALATELANGPQVAMRLLKRTMYNADEMTWDQACDDIATKTAIPDRLGPRRQGGRPLLQGEALARLQPEPRRGPRRAAVAVFVCGNDVAWSRSLTQPAMPAPPLPEGEGTDPPIRFWYSMHVSARQSCCARALHRGRGNRSPLSIASDGEGARG